MGYPPQYATLFVCPTCHNTDVSVPPIKCQKTCVSIPSIKCHKTCVSVPPNKVSQNLCVRPPHKVSQNLCVRPPPPGVMEKQRTLGLIKKPKNREIFVCEGI